MLREDIPLPVLARFLELAYDGLVLYLATGRPTDQLGQVLDLIESAVRRPPCPRAAADGNPDHRGCGSVWR